MLRLVFRAVLSTSPFGIDAVPIIARHFEHRSERIGARLAVENQLDVRRHVGAGRILGMQQGLPSFDGQIAVLGPGTAVRGVAACQLVDQFVARIARMPLHPTEIDGTFALGDFGIDGLDEFGVLHRFLLRVLPAVLLPALHPLGGAVDGVLRIRFDEQRLRAGMRAQRLQHGAQFADLIGAVGRPAVIVATVIVPVPGRASGVPGVIRPSPSHGAVGIAQCRSVRGNGDGHTRSFPHAPQMRGRCLVDSLRHARSAKPPKRGGAGGMDGKQKGRTRDTLRIRPKDRRSG